MPHYFSADPAGDYAPRLISSTIAGKRFEFYTADGVFSKKHVDFGSRFLIETVVEDLPLRGQLLDIGCGYGPIAISLAVLSAELSIDMVDINQRALALARKNIALHQLVQRAQLIHSDEFTVQMATYQIVVSNPPIRAGKSVVQHIYQLAHLACQAGGATYIVIQKKQGMASSRQYLGNLFGNCQVVAKQSGYYVLKSLKT